MKVLLFTLIRAFEFQLGVPKEEILIMKTGIIMRPLIDVNGAQVPQLPLIIGAVKEE